MDNEKGVADDGPGISKTAVAVLVEGAESQLAYGGGIGLWLVNWAGAAPEGTASIEATASGSRVTLRIPDLAGRTDDGPGATAT